MPKRNGIYIASRASLPARAARWKHLRDVEGCHIISSWIDEAGEGETDDFGELWVRIEAEVKSAERVIVYAEPDDFPLKGAYVEAGIAISAGVPIFVVTPGVEIEPRSCRPIGSWISHPLVNVVPSIEAALEGAARRTPGPNSSSEWNSHISGSRADDSAKTTLLELQQRGLMCGLDITEAGRAVMNNVSGK